LPAKKRKAITKGSLGWAVRVAEATAWATALLVVLLLHTDELPEDTYRWGLIASGALGFWLLVQFRLLIRRGAAPRSVLWFCLAANLGFAGWISGILGHDIAATHLLFVPVIVAAGLLGRVLESFLTPMVALGGYYLVRELIGDPPPPPSLALAGGVFLLAGIVAGLIARQLREHYRAEMKEHRLATAVRYRLMSVLDAVDEAIVFADNSGVVRVVNRRAGDIFEISPDEHLGLLHVNLLRVLARKTEDPEDFMELFQELRDEPEKELRVEIEQIIPARRRLRLFSSPALDETGALVGRIDVYTDITEGVRRAEEIGRLYEEARRTAESYQRSLLPDTPPMLPRVSFVAHYVPAAGRRAVCGDFYDFVPLSDGRQAVMLGDVVGIGPKAVADGALTRYTLKSFAGEFSDPGSLVERINPHITAQLSGERFVRLFFGVLDPERAVFEYASAGHVPPVVYHCKTGEVEWLGEGGLPLGVNEDESYKVGRIELQPGDMLVLYTDGVTEAPRNGRPFGQGKFLDLVEEYGVGTPGEMSQAIRRAVDSWVEGGELRDDLAIIVCQVVPDSVFDEPTRELVLPNETSRLSDLRAFVASFLADVRAPVEVSSEIILASSEAAANAVRHGRRTDGRSEIRIRLALEGRKVKVTIVDDGPGFSVPDLGDHSLPDRFASGGRGLFLIRELMDEVAITPSREGTTVAMARRLSAWSTEGLGLTT
jgi:serine phosphatase RsbU (regulator of sigma subunit)/anti-sigma regulatory factor (Ser/Thr protein kinase)/PAS domain-containing protein